MSFRPLPLTRMPWCRPGVQGHAVSQSRQNLAQIALEVRLVIVLRKPVEHSIVGGLVTKLKRINQNHPPTGLEHTRRFADYSAADLGRQLVQQENARHRIATLVRQGIASPPATMRLILHHRLRWHLAFVRYASDKSMPSTGSRGQACLTKSIKRPVPQPMSTSRKLRWSRPANSCASGGNACRRMALAVPLNRTSTWVS